MAQSSWLNRNVAAMGVASFLADVCYEMVTAILPGFFQVIGLAATALGWIEGLADALSSFLKLAVGWYSDRIANRKPIVTLGYLLSGTMLALFAMATSWPLILTGKMGAWFGKGIRGPLRNALLAESVPAGTRGRAFGFHRAADTAGAIVGPALAVVLLPLLPAPDAAAPFRTLFLLSLIPGIGAALFFLLFVREMPGRSPARKPFLGSLPANYRRFLVAVGLFGSGDFSHALLVLAAVTVFQDAKLGALMYLWRNVVYAAVSYPIGAWSDRMLRALLLRGGYALGILVALAAGFLTSAGSHSITLWAAMFAGAGVYVAVQEVLESSIPADLVPPESLGSAYGALGAVNGAGDLIASVLVGTLWTAISPMAGFGAAAVLMALGAATMRTRYADAQ